MSHREPTPLVVAVRAYPSLKDAERDFDKYDRKWKLPDTMFVFDTETRTDQTQRLTFGSYRLIVPERPVYERLFFSSDLPGKDRKVLERYVASVAEVVPRLSLLTRPQFIAKLFNAAYRGRCLLVAFNFPFDISRVAWQSTKARRRFTGGFSFDLWSYLNGRNRYRPSVCIKVIDSKRALKGFTRREEPDEEDMIPEGSMTQEPEGDYTFRGHFLDLRTLAFALTDKSYTLEKACEDFGVEHKKQLVRKHGVVTKSYIDYNRGDVLATSELAVKLLEEYDKHPIDLQATKAYSPASIGKAYLQVMGIKPILTRQRKFPQRYLGHAQSAFFGGRTSAKIRKVAVPVVYTDFRSMYPTVNSLMGLWNFVIAREIKVVKNIKTEIETLLHDLLANRIDLFQPETWRKLPAFVQLIPHGDILPSRGKYNPDSNDWQVAVNHIYANGNDPRENGLWFSLPDVIASVLLTKRVPIIVDAFKITASGKVKVLEATKLRGMVEIDPRTKDFFKVVIEERQRLSARADIGDIERKRLDKALKVLANAASYGIYAEMHRLESDRKTYVTCHGIDARPFKCRVAHPDEPGAYCFPPLASLITGAARLMLALLEQSVTTLGGTYAMEDTDSMAIVATESGEMIPCPGGKRGTIKALSWKQVDEISNRFASLNPYERDAVPGSILKIEDDNREPRTGSPRQLYCLAISAKRYALFVKDANGVPSLLREGVNNKKEDRWSEHGLGHLLNPIDPESEDRDWIAQSWLNIIRRALGLPTKPFGFESAPAVGRVSVSKPAIMRPFSKMNEGKQYADKIKPFNFLLTCHVKPLGHPPQVDATRFHLITPYETDSRLWMKKDWLDQYSAKAYRITTEGRQDRRTARVKSYGDVLLEYEHHAESKCADGRGEVCTRQTVGLLQRRHVRIDQLKYIGKESNGLEEVEAGMAHSPDSVYTEYPDRRRDEWETKTLPILRKLPPAILEQTGLSPRMIMYALAGKRPHPKNQELLTAFVRKLGVL